MKKLVLLAGILLAAVSCKMESTLYMENVSAMANVAEGKLFSDEGIVFNVTENSSKKKDYLVDGARYYMVFDILNWERDIRIKDLQDVVICPSEAQGPVSLFKDPVVMRQVFVSGGYLNLIIAYYKAKANKYEHKMHIRHVMDDKRLKFTLLHDGNGENPAEMDSDELETVVVYCSVPLSEFDYSGMELTFNTVSYDAEGKASVISTTVPMY